MTVEIPKVNHKTKSADNTSMMELKSGTALAKIKAKIQNRKENSAYVDPDGPHALVVVKLKFDFHMTGGPLRI